MTGEVALFLPSRNRHGTGLYGLAFELARPADDAAVVALQRVASVLGACAREGAFPTSGHAPLSSNLRLSLAQRENERCVVFNVEADSVDLHAFELLRNMSQRLLRQGIEVRELRVSHIGSPPIQLYRKPPVQEPQDVQAYPSVAKVRFVVETAEFVDTRMRRCLIDLFAPVTATHVLHLREWVAPWFDLLEAGAYSMPVGPATDVDSLRGDIELFDEVAIELTVNRFQASEAAWAGLVNLLDTCWADGSVISKVTIE